MANLQTPHAAWFINRFRKAKALCVRETTAPIIHAKDLCVTNSCATGVLHLDVARSEHFHESYAQVDPNVAHWGDGVSHLDESDLEMSHNEDVAQAEKPLWLQRELESLINGGSDDEPEPVQEKTSPRAVRFAPYEITIIKERAKAAGCSFNAYVRYSSLGDQYQPPLSQDVRQALLALNHELTKQGNNINQIAKHLNAGIRTPTQANQALEAMRPIYLQTLNAVRTALCNGMEEPAP